MSDRPSTLLVTGGAGFIGSNFLLRLVPQRPETRFVCLDLLTYAGHRESLAAIADAPNFAFVEGDVADAALVEELFREHGVTGVVHFAAESHVDRSIRSPLQFVHTNVVGTAVLLEAARQAWTKHGRIDAERYRFHHVSTDEVFGALGTEGAFDEATPYDPRSPYSASKAGSDHLVRAYGHTYGLPVTLSNCSNNYGPYQHPEKLIPLMIRQAAAEQPLPVYGRGANVRDWLHVHDHVDALALILERGRVGETYCIGGHAERPNLEVVEQVADLVDEALGRAPGTARRLITFVTDRPGHDFRYAMDPEKIERELGWRPAHTFEAGLRETVRWYLDHPEWVAAVTGEAFETYYREHYEQRS